MKASGYTHEYREVEQKFYMLPAVIDGQPSKGHTTLTEVDEGTAKSLWLGGRDMIIHGRPLPEPVEDKEQNVVNLRNVPGTMFHSMSRYPENELRRTYDEIWEIDVYNFKHQYGEIHFIIAGK